MTYTPSNKKLAELAGISASYADKIRRGDKTPSLAKALQIYRTTGLKFGGLAALTDAEVEQVAKALPA